MVKKPSLVSPHGMLCVNVVFDVMLFNDTILCVIQLYFVFGKQCNTSLSQNP